MGSHHQALLAVGATSAGAPPAGPAWPDVQLLMKFEGAHSGLVFSDLSSYARSISNPATSTPMSVRTNATHKKFGISSAVFGNDIVRLLPSGTCGLASEFSIQFWARPVNYSSSLQGILFEAAKLTGDGFDGVSCGSQTNESAVKFYLSGASATWNSSGAPYATYDGFVYIHIYKTGSNIYLYADGVLQGSLAVSGAAIITPGQYSLSVGSNGVTPAMTGWIDELRVISGVTVANTIPSAEFPIGSV